MQGGGTTSAGGSSSSSVGLSGPVGEISLSGSSLPDVDAQGRRRYWLQDGYVELDSFEYFFTDYYFNNCNILIYLLFFTFRSQLMPSYPVSATITQSFKRFLHPGAYTWKMVPLERRQTYREEFRVSYYYIHIF